jgi:thiamine phosphate synthase YjbQ (UPF0047 family)
VETFLMKIKHATIALNTGEGFAAHDISADIRRDVTDAGIGNGFLTFTSQHATTAPGSSDQGADIHAALNI